MPIGVAGLFELALHAVDVARPIVGDRQISLVVDAAGFDCRQPLTNMQGLQIRDARAVTPAQRAIEVADVFERHRQVALIVSASRVSCGQSLGNGQRLKVGVACLMALA